MFEQTLQQLWEKMSRKKFLEARMQELRNQRLFYEQKKAELRAAHRMEQEDVEKLEGRSLAKYFYLMFGRLEEKLDAERREAAAAKVKLDAVERELDAIGEEIWEIQNELPSYAGLEEAYTAALEEKRNAVKAAGDSTAARILALEEEIFGLKVKKSEIQEALLAGDGAMIAADAIIESLQKAEKWNDWDLLGGGGIITHMQKYDYLDKAQRSVERLQDKLRRLKTELADVEIQADVEIDIDDFLRFADYFFDNMFVDLSVASRIEQALSSVQNVRKQIVPILEKLREMEKENASAACALRAELEACLVNG